ncbi:nitrite reductase/ring-hydroxylating ferredoxin subunit [Archangium gephyra]|uniref:Nitrite reductase/ring-hydroxylating ferredoxin subunit n=1 Tax=Archangium gephyra TaxID=48 RepID=A0ABX9K3X4_9BACT|nr:Rieske (2Fe-2S) protein [Archangium gephyra]REG32874.1 nitrite reductase/ring-hydroxylating ferredoxin subunit [Archangium gephyra]
MNRVVFLCRLEELPDGQSRGFDPLKTGRDTVLVVRQGRDLHAWRDDCPHQPGAAMAWRKDAYLNRDGSRIVCHAHGARFDIATGVCTLGPCQGQALTRVPLLISTDHVYAVLSGAD